MIDLDIRLAARLRITQLSRETRRVLRRILAFLATLGLVVASTNTHAYARASSSETAHRGFASVAASALQGEAFASVERIKENVVGAAERTSRLTLGEQFDPELGFYNLRARYYDPKSGRFVSMDTFAGYGTDPPSLHKYLYAHADPVNNIDPTGHVTMQDLKAGLSVVGTMLRTATANFGRFIQRAKLLRRPRGGVGSEVSFGRNANQLHHTFRHVEAAGLDRALVQRAISTDLAQVGRTIVAGQPLNQTIVVAGRQITYTAFRLETGLINVGRITVP